MAKLTFTETGSGKKGWTALSNTIAIMETEPGTKKPIAKIQCQGGGQLIFEVDEWMPKFEATDLSHSLPFIHLRLRETGADIGINIDKITKVETATGEHALNDAVIICTGDHSYQVCYNVKTVEEIVADRKQQLGIERRN